MYGVAQLLFTAVLLVGCIGKVPDDPRHLGDDDDSDDIGIADAGSSGGTADARPPGAPDARPAPPDAAPPHREYPAGPYGTRTGDVITNLSWTGYADDNGNGDPFDDSPRSVSLGEMFEGNDPGAKLIFVNSSAGWCGSCQDEASALPGLYSEYHSRGVRIISTLFETTSGAAASTDFAREWGQTFRLPFPTVADPGSTLDPYYEESSVPMNMLIDAETMRILDVHHGFDSYQTRSLFDAHL